MVKETMLSCTTIIAELKRALACARGREIGGLLLEDAQGRQRIHLAPNLLQEPGCLEVPGWWLNRMLQRQDDSGFRPVAFFHSHLTTLEPSEADRAAMHRLTLPWIILRIEAGHLAWAVYSAVGNVEADAANCS
jgi:proteasome lid subunit RPN8/RPN11